MPNQMLLVVLGGSKCDIHIYIVSFGFNWSNIHPLEGLLPKTGAPFRLNLSSTGVQVMFGPCITWAEISSNKVLFS